MNYPHFNYICIVSVFSSWVVRSRRWHKCECVSKAVVVVAATISYLAHVCKLNFIYRSFFGRCFLEIKKLMYDVETSLEAAMLQIINKMDYIKKEKRWNRATSHGNGTSIVDIHEQNNWNKKTFFFCFDKFTIDLFGLCPKLFEILH